MTRATLLHVLERPTALGAAEVRELEQLAQAFPYCQTAHLLLAKAAHDQGTMLAGQRLRRAATYAADRALLRRLIEQVEPAPAAAHPEPAASDAVEAPAATYHDTETPVSAAYAAPVPEALEALPLPATAALAPPAPTSEFEAPQIAAPAALAATQAPEAAVEPGPTAEAPATPPIAPSEPAPAAVPVVLVAEAAPEAQAAEATEAAGADAAAEIQVAAIPPAETAAPIAPLAELVTPNPMAGLGPLKIDAAPLLIDREGVSIESAAPDEEQVAAIGPEPAAPETEDILPAQAPAIRPPVEVGEARFEFGLAEPPPPTGPTYELPGLVDEWAASAVTRSLGTPEALTLAAPVTAATTAAGAVFTPSAFTGDEELGYGFGESSRLGFSLQLLNLLTDNAESGASQVAAAQPPASPLPPTGTFFEPDPLLCAHWAAHCPPAAALPAAVDLINNFLRRQPRLTRPAMLPPAASHQADLSVRSTRAEPDLVSENLARIFVRQGKNARAIEIYEKLMVKQPEKMAYFAAQIQQLQPSA